MTSDTHIQGRIFEQITKLLEMRDIETLSDSGGRTRASVAMILCHAAEELEVLFIQRSADDNDPWSGHIAFPGGKLEEGESVCQAASRETMEEICIDLEAGRYLGRLSDIVGHNLPVRVSCCVFQMNKSDCVPILSDEVSEVFWVNLTDLRDQVRHITAEVAFEERSFEVPAIRLPFENKPVLWGITYRLLMQFIELLERLDNAVADAEKCCSIPESIELDERG